MSQYDIAGQLERALKRKPSSGAGVMSRDEKEIRYMLGDIYEAEENLALAKESFQLVYEADISYRDVRKRFEALINRSAADS